MAEIKGKMEKYLVLSNIQLSGHGMLYKDEYISKKKYESIKTHSPREAELYFKKEQVEKVVSKKGNTKISKPE